jgi:anti-sigma B factor antagonist
MAAYAVEVRSAPQGRTVISVRGEIDLTVSDELLTTLTCAATTSGVPELVVDLDGVDFLDSSGISALVQAHAVLADEGAQLRVTGGREHIRRVLAVSGVVSLLCADDAGDPGGVAMAG